MTPTPPPSGPVAAALPIIERWAATGQVFGGNQLRDEFDAAGIPLHRRGPAMAWARDHGIVRHVGWVPSTGRSARGAVLAIYRGPDDACRDERGRYDVEIPAGQMTFEEAS